MCIVLCAITITGSYDHYMCYIVDDELSGSKFLSKVNQDHHIIIRGIAILIISTYYVFSLIPLLYKYRKYNIGDNFLIDNDNQIYVITHYFYSYRHKSIMYNYGVYFCIDENSINVVINNKFRVNQVKNILK